MKLSDVLSIILVLSGLILICWALGLAAMVTANVLILGIVEILIGIICFIAVRYSLKRR
jgi:hypothetical protein